MKEIFQGQAVKSELIVLMLEKWGLHPELREMTDPPDENDLDRDTCVVVPAEEEEKARRILFEDSQYDQAEF